MNRNPQTRAYATSMTAWVLLMQNSIDRSPLLDGRIQWKLIIPLNLSCIGVYWQMLGDHPTRVNVYRNDLHVIYRTISICGIHLGRRVW